MPPRRPNPFRASGGLSPWQVEVALRTLLTVDHSIAHVAALCGLSRSHFERAFKATMGIPPHRWLVRQRVRRAGEMLERTDDSISVIALSCGFADQSHLTRMFRTIMGSSPGAGRRRRLADGAPPMFATPVPSSVDIRSAPPGDLAS